MTETLTKIRIPKKKTKTQDKVDRKQLKQLRIEQLPVFENVGGGTVAILQNIETGKIYIERIIDRNSIRNLLDQYEQIEGEGIEGKIKFMPLSVEKANEIIDRIVSNRMSFNSCFVFGDFRYEKVDMTKSDAEHKFTSTGVKFWRHQQQMFEFKKPIDGSPRKTVISTHVSPEGHCNLSCTYCFSGDTKVSLLDGTEETLEELSTRENPFWVYSYDKETKQIVPGRAISAFKIPEKQQTIIIKLDNEQEIECTPDHRFMLRDGSYKQANELTINDSLMPLYRRKTNKKRDGTKGYEQFLDPGTEDWKYTHQRVTEKEKISCLKLINDEFVEINERNSKMSVRHHINFKKWDNTPENLAWMHYEEHIKLHSKYVQKLFDLGLHSSQNPENVKKWQAAGVAKTKELAEQGLTWSQIAVASGTHHFQSEEFKKKTGERCKAQAALGTYCTQRDEFRIFMSDVQTKLVENGTHYLLSDEHRNNSRQRLKLVRKWEKFLIETNQTKEQFPLSIWKTTDHVNDKEFIPTIEWLIDFSKLHNITSYLQFHLHHKRTVRQFINVSTHQIQKLLKENGYETWLQFSIEQNLSTRRRGGLNAVEKMHKTLKVNNHKIIEIKKGSLEKDVYCIEVEKYHNFALTAGVFVSNCSVTYRDTHSRIELPRIKQYVSDLKTRGLKAVILTGGGEPTLYPQFNELVQWIKRDQGLNVALITNGTTNERFEPETLSCFSWVRVSINVFPGWEEKINLRTEHLDKDCVVGASMVFTVEHHARDKSTDDRAELFRSVAKIADKINARYVRLLPNVLLTGERLQMEHAELKKVLDELNDARFFHQHKVHGTPGCSTCHQAYFRPYLSEEKSKYDGKPGSVYPCDSVVLNDSLTHFAQKFQVCNPDRVLDFIDGKIQQEFAPQTDCQGCVFSHNLKALDDYLVRDVDRFDEFKETLLHEEFV